MSTKRNNNIEDILNSLDGAGRAVAPDFFYTRLKARMEKGLAPEPNRGWRLKPAYVIASLVLVLVANATMLIKGDNSSDNTVVAIDTESDQSIAAEYNLYENSIVYDLNQDK
ncbi:MAG: hypothetical protein HOP10_16495 [Chitinophagaceae bacterium]|nr:hypothetical protein [Chitinophagaceae bacterium]